MPSLQHIQREVSERDETNLVLETTLKRREGRSEATEKRGEEEGRKRSILSGEQMDRRIERGSEDEEVKVVQGWRGRRGKGEE